MEENHCVPVMEQGDMEKISKPIDFFGLNCYNRVVDCADDTLKQMEDQKSLGGNFMDNGSEFYPKAVYNAIKIMQKIMIFKSQFTLLKMELSTVMKKLHKMGKFMMRKELSI